MNKVYIIFLGFIFFMSCNKNKYPDRINKILEISDNKKELIQAIDHFQNDSLKKAATYFLIENMVNKGSLIYHEKNKYGENISHDWNQYSSYSEALDSSRKHRIYVELDTILFDINSIKSDILIQNVESAFKVWNESRRQNIEFNDFLNYVLPYRDRNEELSSNWRESILKKNYMLNGIQGKDNLFLADSINEILKLKMKFNYNYSLSVPNPSFNRLDTLSMGSCPYMTSLTIYYMRAFGIPVTRDYVPYWTNIHHFSNHEWNAMLSNDGKWRGFMGCEANPSIYKPTFYAAKVFRETFSNNEIELFNVFENINDVPSEFQRANIIDVTDQYYETGDIVLNVPNSAIGEKALYLAIYNQKEWRVIYWGLTKNNKVVFKKMSKGVVYLLMKRNTRRGYDVISDPFIYDFNGEVKSIRPNKELVEDVSVYSFGLGSLSSKDYINPLEADKSYTLRYWNNDKWIKIESKKALRNNDTLYFSNVPKEALLSLGRDDNDNDSGEQLFVNYLGKQKFY